MTILNELCAMKPQNHSLKKGMVQSSMYWFDVISTYTSKSMDFS